VGRILALDVGERRIGLAISDPEGLVAVPLRILERTKEPADLQAILEIAHAEGVDTLLVGNPISMTGHIGPQAQRVRSFGHRLAQAASLPLVLWDERLSSAEAERFAPQGRGGKRRGSRRVPKDDIAAALVLQSYLDRRRAGRTPPPA
jgi:putative Holliday junction resolvase